MCPTCGQNRQSILGVLKSNALVRLSTWLENLIYRNSVLITGGVQKEAFFYRIPCVTLRDQTEWTELVELGWNVVAPPISAKAVADAILANLDHRGREGEPYGDGGAAKAIATVLCAAIL
jgi:UDP-N-acetylglucosamine 2-epimerase